MELITLDSSFQPVSLVESYSSLVWTERYSKAGDFELKTTNVQQMITDLPLESVISLRESTVPMVVELHKIEKNKGSAASVTITGRSFETVLERRASVNSLPSSYSSRTPWMMIADTPSDAAYKAIRQVIGDVIQTRSGVNILPARTPAVSANDAIPEISLTRPADYLTAAWSSTIIYSPGDLVGDGTSIYQATSKVSPQNLNVPPAFNPTYWTVLYSGQTGAWGAGNIYEIKPADLYNTVMELLDINHHGIKAVRPVSAGNKIGIEIYNGADLTNTIVFDARFDQFDSSTYLLSEQGSSDVAYVYGSNGSQSVLKNIPPEPAGLARRVILVDESSNTSINSSDIRNTRGLIELYKYNATALFDGQIADQVAAGFNSRYFLGDILRLDGEYGLTESVRVAEYIRTSDSSGDRAYPAFEAIL